MLPAGTRLRDLSKLRAGARVRISACASIVLARAAVRRRDSRGNCAAPPPRVFAAVVRFRVLANREPTPEGVEIPKECVAVTLAHDAYESEHKQALAQRLRLVEHHCDELHVFASGARLCCC